MTILVLLQSGATGLPLLDLIQQAAQVQVLVVQQPQKSTSLFVRVDSAGLGR